MAYPIAIFFVALTAPIWGGALVAVMGLGLSLFFKAPLLLLLIFLAPFILNNFL